MTSSHCTPAPREAAAESQDGLLLLADLFVQAQRVQWEAFLDWQRSLATFNSDFWEQWAVRYAGGMPIDG